MNLIKDYFRELADASWRGWNRFWFTPADPATLGLIRVFAGAMLFYTHVVWAVDLTGFFGAGGRLTARFAQDYHFGMIGPDHFQFAWSPLYYLDSTGSLWFFHIAALVVLLLFTFGCFTRVTAVLAFLITVSYTHRAVGALFGLDQINGMLALYLAVGPSGAAFSVDRWWRGRRGPETVEPPKLVMANVAQRLIQIHMCVIYFFAGFGKLLGQTWWSGTALWGAFANFEYQTLDLTWLAAYPLIVNVLTQVTLAWEISYCVLVWPRLTRPVVLALAIPLHLGIAFAMGMITFGLVMLVGNLAFVSPVLVRRLVQPRGARGQGSHAPGRSDAGQGARTLV